MNEDDLDPELKATYELYQDLLHAMAYSYSNGAIERTNNLIKVIKRIAFG